MSERGRWRIDELARLGRLTVDTVRYYLREGLLPPAERSGRHKVYGPEHLRRLEQIRELQAQRFSLAAIRALLESEQPGLVERLFGSGSSAYSYEELIERSGIDRALADRLREAGFLSDPAEIGRETYDSDDLDALCALHEFRRVGLPDDVIVEIASVYARGVESMHSEALDVFTGRRDRLWEPDELAAFRARGTETAEEIVPLVGRALGYAHRRAIQRLTLRAIQTGAGLPEEG
jgi:DNA-binding transcriptional MerR regulator